MAVANPYTEILKNLESQNNQQKTLLQQQRDAQLKQAQNQYDTSKRTLNSEFSTGARGAYVDYMKDLQNVPLISARFGNGGQSERAKVDMTNVYQNNFGGLLSQRNSGYQELDTGLLNQRNDLNNTYNQGLLSLTQSYDSQRNNALANQAAFDAEQRRQAELLAAQKRLIAAQEAAAAEARAAAAAARSYSSSGSSSSSSNRLSDSQLTSFLNEIVGKMGYNPGQKLSSDAYNNKLVKLLNGESVTRNDLSNLYGSKISQLSNSELQRLMAIAKARA